MIGEVIGDRYRVLDQIGEDPLAISYLARDQSRNEMVVLKVIRPELDAEGGFLKRFRRETEKLERLISPQAVKILDYDRDEAGPYVVFEYVGEKTLADVRQAEGRLALERALDIARQLGLCLVDAHAHDLVHGDLRPAYVLLKNDGQIKVTNFGLAWGLDLGRLISGGELGRDVYHAPELAAGGEGDGRSDLYSLGVTLFEMLTGEQPALTDDLSNAERRPSRLQPDLPPELDDLIARCLAPAPSDRPQSAAEFLEGIEETLHGVAARSAVMGMEEALAGHTLGPYRLVEKLGHGGMAAVYKAYEPSLDRYVAIKVLPQHFAHDPQFLTRFRREAKAIARLNHPNIVPVFNFGKEGDLTYIAMRFVEGGTLKEMMGQPMALERAIKIILQIAHALSYAHQRDVVHRDVKPANVLMAEGDWPLLSDFGLARMMGSSVQLTQTGVGVGTPAYMSPEQGQGLKVDGRSDIYSLGIMLYEMMTGQVPFRADTPLAVVLKHITAPLPMPHQVNPAIPESIERVILKATAKDSAQRYQTADEMIEALERALAGLPVEAPPTPTQIPVTDTIVPIAPPSAVTRAPAPAAEVSTATEVVPVPARKLPIPAWALGLIGLLVVGALIAGAALSGLFSRETEQAEVGQGGTVPAALVGEGGDFWDFESGDAQGWALDARGWHLIEVEDGHVLEARMPKAGSEGPSPRAYPPDHLVPDDFYLSFRVNIADGMPVVTFRDDSDTSGCRYYELRLDRHNLEIWKQTEECEPPNVKLIEAPSPLGYKTWHQVGLIAVGPVVEVTIDDQHVISLEDAEAILGGSLNFGTGGPPGSSFYIDDVRISPITRQEAKAQLEKSGGNPVRATPVTSAAPAPGAPISASGPPTGASEVRPCDWDGLGPGLCFHPLGGGKPTRILEDTQLEFTGPPSWSPDGRQIAFSALKPGESGDRDNKIYIVNADGSGLTQLPSIGNDISPTWSPDGAWLAFHSNGGIATMHPDGSDPAWIWEGTPCSFDPEWSPDSQWIAISMNMEGCKQVFPMRREVWVISRDGTEVTTVATIPHQEDRCVQPEVAFSPDGAQVAYFDGECRPWIVNRDGSGQAEPLDDFPYSWKSSFHPRWEGEERALPPKPTPLAQPEGKFVKPCEGPKPPQICIHDVRTDQVIRVTDNLEFGEIHYASWSPDGQQIIFDAGSDTDHKLYLIKADGSGLKQVTSGDSNDTWPVWSPDGEWIAFHRNCDLWIVHPDGSDGRSLLAGSSNKICAEMMTWSPDSQQIAFSNTLGPSQETARREVWVIKRDGTHPHTIFSFEQPLRWAQVAWSPDGQRIACWYEADDGMKGLLINAEGVGEPQPMDKDSIPWSWFPNYWPQWGGKMEVPGAAPVPADPWGQVVVPPGGTIKLAFVGALSGDLASLGEAQKNALLMAIDDLETIKGFPVEAAIVADDGCTDEGVGRQAAESVVSSPDIAGVIGHTCSSSCGIGAETYEGTHLVMISPSCTVPRLSDPGYQIFNRVAIRDDQGGDERNQRIVDTAPYHEFARRYQNRYGQSLDSVSLGFFAAYAYDATVTLIQAIKQVSAVDEAGNLVIGRQALAEAVRATSNYPGITGIISFDDKGDRLP